MELSYISGLLRRSLCAILLCLQAQGLYLVCDLWYLTFDVIYDATIKIFLILIFQRLLYLFSRKQYPTVFQNCGRFPYSSLMPRCLYLFMKRQLYFACAWLWYLSFQNVFWFLWLFYILDHVFPGEDSPNWQDRLEALYLQYVSQLRITLVFLQLAHGELYHTSYLWWSI